MKPIPAGSWFPSALRFAFQALCLGAFGGLASAQAPVAQFTTNPNPAEGGAPLTVQFLDRSTGTITSWTWNFGDGTGSNLRSPTHVFTAVQPYDVSLTVRGPRGSNTFTLLHAVDVVETTNGIVGAPPPLDTLPVPVPTRLADFVSDRAAAVRLGKALFWDLQLGSDGLTACASCHYQGGADNRVRNSLAPGADGVFSDFGNGGGPNHAFRSSDFPFRKYLLPNTGGDLMRDSDDVRGTAGVARKEFRGVESGSAFDAAADIADETFHVGGTKTLQVTGRDAPSVIGSVYFHRLFWDGRANHFFNGVNIWGEADPSKPTVLEKRPDGSVGEIAVLLDNAATASQAIGPPLSGVEMSWIGRTWPEVGRKLLPRGPLAGQHVDLTDSVLGELASAGGPGLAPGLTYEDLVREAFHERWWGGSTGRDGFTHMEANFSLFFGLAILAYESTLVPDQAPYDRWARGDVSALGESEVRGLALFTGRAGCINCHATPIFAGATVGEVRNPDGAGEGALELMAMANPVVTGGLSFTADTNRLVPDRRAVGLYSFDGELVAWARLPAGLRCAPAGEQLIPLTPTGFVAPDSDFSAELRATSDGNCGLRFDLRFSWNENGPAADIYTLRLAGKQLRVLVKPGSKLAVYDNGFYNVGLRPTTEDLGVGAEGPFGPLSMTRRVQNGNDIGHAPGVAEVPWHARVAVDGAFKTPTLRNVELTGPYFHNGSMATLEQVVEFYGRGADFAVANRRDLDPDIGGFLLTEQNKADLVAFLKSLTDPRVRFEQAPFDHPELILKEGHVGDHRSVANDGTGNAIPSLVYKPATGTFGGPAVTPFADRLPAGISATVLSQNAFGAQLGFVCDKRPSAPVTIHLALSVPAMATLSTTQVVFTPDTWRVGQKVLVVTVDPDSAGGSNLVVATSPALSSDPDFQFLPVADLTLDFLSTP